MVIMKKSTNNKYAGEGAEKRESFYTVCGNVNYYSHYEEQYGGSLKKKLKIEPPYDPAIPLLGMYLGKTMMGKDSGIPKFTAALFAIANA